MNSAEKFLFNDRFASDNGIELLSCKPGFALAKFTIRKTHLNGAGILHGGMIFTLADSAFAAAVNVYGKVSLSIQASIYYLQKCEQSTLIAEAKEISRSGKLSTCEIMVKKEDEKELLAKFTGTAYITNKPVVD